MSTSYYPNVLILGEQFDRVRGGGITLSSLFEGWPQEHMSVASGYAPTLETMNASAAYYLLGNEEFVWPWPLTRFVRQPRSGQVTDRERIPLYACIPGSGTRAPSRTGRLFTWMQNVVGVDGLLPHPKISTQFLHWMSKQQPEVIYAQVSSFQTIRFVASVAKTTGLPLVLHQMDDWLPVAYGTGIIGSFIRARTNSEFASLTRIASLRIGICNGMSQEYRRRYGGAWMAFHNPTRLTRFRSAAKRSWKAGKPFRIRYGGRVGWGIRESILEFCDAVSELQIEGYDLNFEIYSSQANEPGLANTQSKQGVRLRDPVKYESLPAELASADLLLICYDWDEESNTRARFSMPTKATEFMASGTPILVYAPPNLAVTKYAREEGWGYVMSEHSVSALKAAIVRLATDEAVREQIGRRAMEVASRNHDATKVREEFRRVLCEAAAQGHEARRKCMVHP